MAKKTELYSDSRNFNDECTLKYLFILPTLPNSKLMCLLCNECVSTVKEYNLKWQFTTKHGDLEFCTWKFRLLENQRLNHVISSGSST